MKPKTKKAKGNSFEAQVAELIHLFCVKNFPDYNKLFETFNDPKLKPRRDASSGSSKDSDGDINLGLAWNYIPVSFECKHWKTLDLSLDQLLKGNLKSLTNVYHKQASLKKSERIRKCVIAFKGNYTSNFVFFHQSDFELSCDHYVRIGEWIICSLTDFLSIFS